LRAEVAPPLAANMNAAFKKVRGAIGGSVDPALREHPGRDDGVGVHGEALCLFQRCTPRRWGFRRRSARNAHCEHLARHHRALGESKHRYSERRGSQPRRGEIVETVVGGRWLRHKSNGIILTGYGPETVPPGRSKPKKSDGLPRPARAAPVHERYGPRPPRAARRARRAVRGRARRDVLRGTL
jgi:hypothetical protein